LKQAKKAPPKLLNDFHTNISLFSRTFVCFLESPSRGN
jgi:hypothetical protein